jgi:succinate-semialdehyde dehydrogenase/glutarate-semialdehyde dehydrogenase
MKLDDTSLLKQDAWIAGSWSSAADGRRIAIHNPANGSVVGEVPMMGAAETKLAIEAAAAALPMWSRKTAKERAVILRRFADLMIANTNDLAIIMTAEQGKPLAESKGEIAYAASFIEWFAEEGKRIYGDVIPTFRGDSRVMVLRQPVGVAAAITPWNFHSQTRPSAGRRLHVRVQTRAADSIFGTGLGRTRAARGCSGWRIQHRDRRCRTDRW